MIKTGKGFVGAIVTIFSVAIPANYIKLYLSMYSRKIMSSHQR